MSFLTSFVGAIQGSVTLLCVAPPIATVPDKVEAPLMVVVPYTLRIPVSVIVAPAPLAVQPPPTTVAPAKFEALLH